MSQLGYAIGLIAFSDYPTFRYELFEKSLESMGVLSIAWTALLKANIELSITMTIVNAILAYGEMR